MCSLSAGSATLHPRLLIARPPWGRSGGDDAGREDGCPPRRDAIHRVSPARDIAPPRHSSPRRAIPASLRWLLPAAHRPARRRPRHVSAYSAPFIHFARRRLRGRSGLFATPFGPLAPQSGARTAARAESINARLCRKYRPNIAKPAWQRGVVVSRIVKKISLYLQILSLLCGKRLSLQIDMFGP